MRGGRSVADAEKITSPSHEVVYPVMRRKHKDGEGVLVELRPPRQIRGALY